LAKRLATIESNHPSLWLKTASLVAIDATISLVCCWDFSHLSEIPLDNLIAIISGSDIDRESGCD
jgi:hypothetical protein